MEYGPLYLIMLQMKVKIQLCRVIFN